MRPRYPAFLVVCLLVAGCAPREPIISRDEAMKDRREFEVRILAVHDAMDISRPTETSHLVEVSVIGAAAGTPARLTLPYDEWAVGAPPPKPGAVLRITPAQWVRPSPTSTGRPREGWSERR
jgi:hypothetical protein